MSVDPLCTKTRCAKEEEGPLSSVCQSCDHSPLIKYMDKIDTVLNGISAIGLGILLVFIILLYGH